MYGTFNIGQGYQEWEVSIYFVFAVQDSDGDEVSDDKDKCRNTPKGVEVDESGCPINQPPTASFTVMPQNPTPDDDVVCETHSEDPDDDPLICTWLLDDKELGIAVNCGLGQLKPGEYTITLKVDDGRGGEDECSKTITVAYPVEYLKGCTIILPDGTTPPLFTGEIVEGIEN